MKPPAELKSFKVMPLYCLTGEDVYRKLRFLKKIKEIIFSKSDGMLNYEYLLGDEANAATILDAARTPAWGLFSGNGPSKKLIDRLIVIDQAELLPTQDWNSMGEYFSTPAPDSCLVFLVNRKLKGWSARTYFDQEFIQDFSPLKPKEQIKWAQAEARRKKLSIPYNVIEEIVAVAGGAPGAIAEELEKLYLYKGSGGEISPDDVKDIVGLGQRDTIFALAGLIVTRKTNRALKLLRGLLNKGEAPLKILALMIRVFRQYWLGIETWKRTGDRRLTCQAAGVRVYQSEFIEQIKNIKSGYIPIYYRRLVEVDDALKGGEKLHSLTLEKLVIELSILKG